MKRFWAARGEYSRGENGDGVRAVTAQNAGAQNAGARIEAQRAAPLPWERLANYLASYACTLLTIFAAYPIAPLWCLGLALMTCAGLPLSLEVRRRDQHFGRVRIDRFFFNFFIVALSGVLSLVYLGAAVPGIGSGGAVETAIRLGSRLIDVMALVFLIFAACRSLFILSDKDAFRSLVPSFAVLLLLVVTQHNTSIIAVFLLWTVAAVALMALDHRAETRFDLVGVVPAPVPGQDVTLSLRSLAGIVVFSLTCAAALSFVLASSSADKTSVTENWIVNVLSRLGVPGLETSDASMAFASERGIDFSSRPASLSKAPAWRVAAYDLTQKRSMRPAYWRLYALSFYDGATWQPRDRLNFSSNASTRRDVRRRVRRVPLQAARGAFPRFPAFGRAPRGFYDFTDNDAPQREKTFGAPANLVQQRIESLSTNAGFVPGLPVATRLALAGTDEPRFIQARPDASVEAGAMTPGRVALLWSRTPQENYQTQAAPPQLDAADRERNLRLPPKTPSRVLALARRMAAESHRAETPTRVPTALRVLATAPDAPATRTTTKTAATITDREVQVASRLSAFVRGSGSYTLSPPPMPPGRDAADFFLFETHAGYCTHFASTLAVMCRAAGLPSRVVSGYVDPEWENDKIGNGILRESAAHAWTEVWIGGRGWTTFDATPPDDRGDNEPTAKRTWQLWWRGLLDGARRAMGRAFPVVVALLCATFTLCAFLVLRARLKRFKRREIAVASFHNDAPDDAVRRDILHSFATFEERVARDYRARAAAETPRQWLQTAPRVLASENNDAARELLSLRDRALYQTQILSGNAAQRARELLQRLGM